MELKFNLLDIGTTLYYLDGELRIKESIVQDVTLTYKNSSSEILYQLSSSKSNTGLMNANEIGKTYFLNKEDIINRINEQLTNKLKDSN